jgi:hypothetical protein
MPLFEANQQHNFWGTRQFIWIADLEVAFERLKGRVMVVPILYAPAMGNWEFTLYCSVSKFTVGAMLSQRQEGVNPAISYYSRKLKPVKTYYAVYDCQLLTPKKCMLH